MSSLSQATPGLASDPPSPVKDRRNRRAGGEEEEEAVQEKYSYAESSSVKAVEADEKYEGEQEGLVPGVMLYVAESNFRPSSKEQLALKIGEISRALVCLGLEGGFFFFRA